MERDARRERYRDCGPHPDLAGKALPGYNSLYGNNDAAPKNGDNHGTAVAGVAAARANDATGVAGVCWYCKILPVKVAERDPQGNWTTNGCFEQQLDHDNAKRYDFECACRRAF
ncbi:MAG: hypothetical protein DCC52_15120 [Chloroflexi bacterium]|nr:MAG: hypothetical protein DCC52_15120 [Chloroflexota bacterium]